MCFLGPKVNAKPVLLYFTKFLSIEVVLFCSPTTEVCQCLCIHSILRTLPLFYGKIIYHKMHYITHLKGQASERSQKIIEKEMMKIKKEINEVEH